MEKDIIMTRTVKGTKFTYAEVAINEAGQLVATEKTISVMEGNEKKAIKKAQKEVGYFKPLKTEIFEKKYELDDETFFKYAKEVQ